MAKSQVTIFERWLQMLSKLEKYVPCTGGNIYEKLILSQNWLIAHATVWSQQRFGTRPSFFPRSRKKWHRPLFTIAIATYSPTNDNGNAELLPLNELFFPWAPTMDVRRRTAWLFINALDICLQTKGKSARTKQALVREHNLKLPIEANETHPPLADFCSVCSQNWGGVVIL